MQYLLLVYTDPEHMEALPQAEYDRLMHGCITHADELRDSGYLLASQQLEAPEQARTVRVRAGTSRVIDGPFAETRELVAGFWLWQVRSMDEAIEWAKRCPNPMPGPSELEIRPLYEAEDFGAEFTPELREQEDRLRERLGN